MARHIQLGSHQLRILAILLAVPCLFASAVRAQSAAQRNSVPATAPEPKAPTPQLPTVAGTQLDRVVAIVNGELILDSDVDQERRLAALLPYGEGAGPYSRDKAIERLINRDLILQQSRLQPENEITDATAAQDLDALRKSIPTCKEFHCETQPGWASYLATQGFTEASLLGIWKERMEVLAFIEERFRMGITIRPAQIQSYYETTMLPLYAQQHVAPPSLESISHRIQEVLLQRQVSSLLDDWLKSLRAQGSVVVLHPGEGAP